MRAAFVARQWASANADGRVHLRADPAHKLPNPILYRRAEAEACWRNISAPVLLIRGEKSPFADQVGGITSLPFPNAELPRRRADANVVQVDCLCCCHHADADAVVTVTVTRAVAAAISRNDLKGAVFEPGGAAYDVTNDVSSSCPSPSCDFCDKATFRVVCTMLAN